MLLRNGVSYLSTLVELHAKPLSRALQHVRQTAACKEAGNAPDHKLRLAGTLALRVFKERIPPDA